MNLDWTVPYCTFALTTFLGVLFLYFCLPETKGKTLEEIQQELKGKEKVSNTTEKI
jgi:H+/Cl- antiporter ClcA